MNSFTPRTLWPPHRCSPLTLLVHADGNYVTQWDVRMDAANGTVTAVGARCSDGSLLTPVPGSQLLTASPDVYFTTWGQSGVDDGNVGWTRLPLECAPCWALPLGGGV